MYAESVSSCRKSILIGGVISIIGVLIGLGSLAVLSRVDGDFFAPIDGTPDPAWTHVAILIVAGTLVFIFGIVVAWFGCRMARDAADVDAEELAAAEQAARGQSAGPFFS